MRFLEHRRHSRRDPLGARLTPDGVALARQVGRTIGRFDRVETSPKPRAVETAIALGFTVDRELPALEGLPDEVAVRVDAAHPRTFADYAALVQRSGTVARFGRAQADLWRQELLGLPDGGRLLLVSHGGVIEVGAVAAVPALGGTGGPALGYLEGVRLSLDGDRWTAGAVVRVTD
jgi:broad specificity phosphatase PhoE